MTTLDILDANRLDTHSPTGRTSRSAADGAPLRPFPGTTVSFGGVLRSEAVKLRSLRSSTLTVLATCFALAFIGLITAAIAGGLIADPGGDAAAPGAVASAPLSGALLAQLVIGVLGVMVITSEYATGMIRSTFTVVPARLPVLWAKALVVIAATLPAVLVTLFGTFLLGQALIGTGDMAIASLGDDGVLRAVFGTGAYLTGVALLGLALGTILRGTAAAISVLFGLVFLLPGLGQLLLPASWRDDVLQYLPSNAGSAFSSVVPGPELLSTGPGAAVFAAWVLVPLAAAALVLKRRNA